MTLVLSVAPSMLQRTCHLLRLNSTSASAAVTDGRHEKKISTRLVPIGAEWILHDSGPGGEDFFSEMERHRAMRDAGKDQRSLADIARRDNRLQEIKDRLENNKMEREAGKKYTPHEQREFVNERGVARNADKLDLEGTHYESHRYLGPRANGENVRDEELFLGL
jgi:hypothetical protein